MKRVLTRSYAKAGAGPWSSGFMPLRVGYEASRSLNNSSSNDSWNSSPTISGKVRHRATTESLRENNIVQKRFYAGASQQEKNEPKKSEPSQERESEQELSGFRRLLAEWKPIFSRQYLKDDLLAGFTVTMVAVPLNLAIAIGSGVPPELGLVTGILAGATGALFGGARLSVSGPAAATAMLVSHVVRDYGLGGLAVTTLLCGGLQILTGTLRAGGVIKFIPSPLIAGFIGGIGALIISNECSRALGVVNQPGTSLAGTLMATSDPFTTLISLINPGSLLLAGVTVFTALAIAKRYPKYPAIMVSVAVATLLQTIFQLPGVQMIGELPASLPAPSLPAIPQLSDMTGIGLYSLLFYGVASMESLLSAAALDKLSKAKEPHDANQELVGQGIGNVTCSMFGGLLATSVIVRSSLSVIAGAKTRRAALVHSAMLMAAVYLASPLFAYIPVPALSGVLITAGLRMLNPAELKHVLSISRMEALPAAITFATLLVSGDLLGGVGLGLMSSLCLNYFKPEGRMPFRWTLEQQSHSSSEEDVRVTLSGAVNFLASMKLAKLQKDILDTIKSNNKSSFHQTVKIQLDLTNTSFIDVTGGDLLAKMLNELSAKGHLPQLIGVSPQYKDVLLKSHVPETMLLE